MFRVKIQQFRATLVDGTEQDILVRTYRRLARRPGLAAGMTRFSWVDWPPVAAPVARA